MRSKVPVWAWVAALIVVGVVVFGVKVLPAKKRTHVTVAGESDSGLAQDVAAALSGQPSTNASPIDQLGEETRYALGVSTHEFDTMGAAMIEASNSVVFLTTRP